jgi:hypothetical protein
MSDKRKKKKLNIEPKKKRGPNAYRFFWKSQENIDPYENL